MRIVELDQRVGDGEPELITRFRGKAERRCRKLNKQREVNWYRFEVFKVDGKWEVVAMQNIALHHPEEEVDGVTSATPERRSDTAQ